MSFLSVNELVLAYGWQKLLDGVTLSVSPGEIRLDLGQTADVRTQHFR